MSDNKNISLNDDMIAQATGGVTEHVRYGRICDGTVISERPWQGNANGTPFTGYTVKGDDQKSYGCIWDEDDPPRLGQRVKITHVEKGKLTGCYQAVPI